MNPIVRMNKTFYDVKKTSLYNYLKKPDMDFIVSDVEDVLCTEILIHIDNIALSFLYFDESPMVICSIFDKKNTFNREIEIPLESFDYKVVIDILREEYRLRYA